MSAIDSAVSNLIASHDKNWSQVSVKAVGSQLVIMVSISVSRIVWTELKRELLTVLAFSFFRPREKKVYAPKVSLVFSTALTCQDKIPATSTYIRRCRLSASSTSRVQRLLRMAQSSHSHERGGNDPEHRSRCDNFPPFHSTLAISFHSGRPHCHRPSGHVHYIQLQKHRGR